MRISNSKKILDSERLAPSRGQRKTKRFIAVALALMTGIGAISFAVISKLQKSIASATPGFSARAAYDRGQAAYKGGNYSLAIVEYTEAIRLDIYYADAFYARSLAYRSLGDLERADSDLSESMRLRAR
jgi:tetratricopeptide (TPR) repeat protein